MALDFEHVPSSIDSGNAGKPSLGEGSSYVKRESN